MFKREIVKGDSLLCSISSHYLRKIHKERDLREITGRGSGEKYCYEGG